MNHLAEQEIYDLSPTVFLARLHDALALYTTAMGYSPDVISYRAQPWREDTRRPGWQAVGAFQRNTPQQDFLAQQEPQAGQARVGPKDLGENPNVADRDLTPGSELIGFAYAYKGSSDLAWHQHVARAARGLGPAGQSAVQMLEDYVELTEIHVRPGLQGLGLGETLLRRLMLGRTEAHVLLSTPEVAQEANRAWRLYRRLGFVDVIRQMRFPGDSRPFAILGRSLPLRQSAVPQES